MGILRIWLIVLKFTPPNDAVNTVKSGYEHDAHTMAINTRSIRTSSSFFYGYPHNDAFSDILDFVVLHDSSG